MRLAGIGQRRGAGDLPDVFGELGTAATAAHRKPASPRRSLAPPLSPDHRTGSGPGPRRGEMPHADHRQRG
jgi:hypothetical protein